jgi:hypothetical protein
MGEGLKAQCFTLRFRSTAKKEQMRQLPEPEAVIIASRWLKEHPLGENHGYILSSASETEFANLKVL